MATEPSGSIFTQTALHGAAQKLLADEAVTIPDHHGFVSIVDEKGAQVAVGTRLGDSWELSAGGGYQWADQDRGWHGRLTVGKSWK